jgi:hypothetical protein
MLRAKPLRLARISRAMPKRRDSQGPNWAAPMKEAAFSAKARLN